MNNFLMKICRTGSNISFIPDPYMSSFIKTPMMTSKKSMVQLKAFELERSSLHFHSYKSQKSGANEPAGIEVMQDGGNRSAIW